MKDNYTPEPRKSRLSALSQKSSCAQRHIKRTFGLSSAHAKLIAEKQGYGGASYE